MTSGVLKISIKHTATHSLHHVSVNLIVSEFPLVTVNQADGLLEFSLSLTARADAIESERESRSTIASFSFRQIYSVYQRRERKWKHRAQAKWLFSSDLHGFVYVWRWLLNSISSFMYRDISSSYLITLVTVWSSWLVFLDWKFHSKTTERERERLRCLHHPHPLIFKRTMRDPLSV